MTSVSAALERSKSWVWSRRLRVAVLVIVLALTAPWPARGQAISPCCAILAAGLSSIANSLQTIARSLSAILGVDKGMLQFEQTVVWPTSAITQAQALVGSQDWLLSAWCGGHTSITRLHMAAVNLRASRGWMWTPCWAGGLMPPRARPA